MAESSQQTEDDIEPITEWPVSEHINPPLHLGRKTLAYKESERKRKISDCRFTEIKYFKGDDSKIHHKCAGNEVFAMKHEMLASTAVARWWRREGQNLVDRSRLPETTNPNTLISCIIRMEPTKQFIRNEIKRLSKLVDEHQYSANTLAALGSFYEKTGELESAEKYLKWSVDVDDQNGENKWLLKRIQKQLNVERTQEKLMQNLCINNLEQKLTFPASKEVLRISADDLSYKDFFYDYALTSTPVIITDLVKRMTPVPWTFDYIKQIAGKRTAPLKMYIEESVEWARLEDYKNMSVREFIEGMDSFERKCYLFDWSLPVHCPELAEEITIPKYFAGDLLQRTKPGSLYKDSWPSLFIAPAGLKSELHVDAFGSNFWMALFQGQKRWTFFGKEEFASLYPKYFNSMDPVFDVDLSHVDLDRHPLLSQTQPIECILKSGELLFVPAGCPHRVENLTSSIAISSNFVDLSNISLVKEDLLVNGYIDPRAKDLYEQLQNPRFDVKMSCGITDKTWKEFKSFSCKCETETFNNSITDVT